MDACHGLTVEMQKSDLSAGHRLGQLETWDLPYMPLPLNVPALNSNVMKRKRILGYTHMPQGDFT